MNRLAKYLQVAMVLSVTLTRVAALGEQNRFSARPIARPCESFLVYGDSLPFLQRFESIKSDQLLEMDSSQLSELAGRSSSDYLKALGARGVKVEPSNKSVYALRVTSHGAHPINELARKLKAIGVVAEFNSGRKLGISPLRGASSPILSLRLSDLSLGESGLYRKFEEARQIRDVRDFIEVTQAYLLNDLGSLESFKEHYEIRHRSRRQRRFRVLKSAIPKNADSSTIVRIIQDKEINFLASFQKAFWSFKENPGKSSSQEKLGMLISHYLSATGIPNYLFYNQLQYSVVILSIDEGPWWKQQQNFEDGITDPSQVRLYPDLLRLAQISESHGYKLSIPIDESLFEFKAHWTNQKIYHLSSSEVFSEFLPLPRLLEDDEFEALAEDENPLRVRIHTSLQELQQEMKTEGQSDPRAYIARTSLTANDLERLLAHAQNEGSLSETEMSALQAESEALFSSLRAYTKLVEQNVDPRQSKFDLLEKTEQVNAFKDADLRPTDANSTPFNTPFHPGQRTAGPVFAVFQYLHRFDPDHPLSQASQKNLFDFFEKHPIALSEAYLGVRSEILTTSAPAKPLVEFIESVGRLRSAVPLQVFDILQDIVENAHWLDMKNLALEEIAKHFSLQDLLRLRPWLLREESRLIPMTVLQSYESTGFPFWNHFSIPSVAKFLELTDEIDANFVERALARMGRSSDPIKKEAYYASLAALHLKRPDAVQRAKADFLKSREARNYLMTIGGTDPQIVNFFVDHFESAKGSERLVPELQLEIIVSLDQMGATLSMATANVIRQTWDAINDTRAFNTDHCLKAYQRVMSRAGRMRPSSH